MEEDLGNHKQWFVPNSNIHCCEMHRDKSTSAFREMTGDFKEFVFKHMNNLEINYHYSPEEVKERMNLIINNAVAHYEDDKKKREHLSKISRMHTH